MSHIYIYIYVHIYVYICMHTDIGAFPKKSAIVYCFFQRLFGFLRGACPKSCEIACFFFPTVFWVYVFLGVASPRFAMYYTLAAYVQKVYQSCVKHVLLHGVSKVCQKHVQDT